MNGMTRSKNMMENNNQIDLKILVKKLIFRFYIPKDIYEVFIECLLECTDEILVF